MAIKKLREVRKFSNLREILVNKDLAKLGDPFVNFVYSLAKSCVLGTYSGWKIPDKVLAQSLRDANLRSLVSLKASNHDLGDAVEALIVHEWLFQKISIEEITNILCNQLKNGDFSDRVKESRIAVQGFTSLLLEIQKEYTSE